MSSDAPASDIAVRVQGLGKCYHIYDRPLDRLKQTIFRGRRRFYREFWALRDVSFDLRRGECLGIVGQNGSGKSTLLQMIAGTLRPSEGDIWVRGRLAALLELGAGFNPEFTGRENVFTNGAILGLSRAEMEAKFDQIAAFADIGNFIDQPVKTYSSGMYVRLAFAVASNIEPDVLIIDEALAVGDMQFRHKCTAHIRRLIENGTTLIYVSHDPETVKALCQKGIWLHAGRVKLADSSRMISQRYMESLFVENNALNLQQQSPGQNNPPNPPLEQAAASLSGEGVVDIRSVQMLDQQGIACDALAFGEPFSLEVTLAALVDINHISVGFTIKDYVGIELTGESIFNSNRQGITLRAGQTAKVRFSGENNLRPGEYSVSLRIHQVSRWDRSDNIMLYNDDTAAVFRVLEDPDQPMWFRFRHRFAITTTVIQ